MKKGLVGLMAIACLGFSAVSVFASYAGATNKNAVPDKKPFMITGGKVQICLNGDDWQLFSQKKGLKVWVLKKNYSSKKSWQPLGEDERILSGLSVVRLENCDGKEGAVRVEGNWNPSLKREFVLNFEDVNLLKGSELIKKDNFEKLMFGGKLFKLISPKTAVSLDVIASENLGKVIPGRSLCGFIIPNKAGFLVDFVELDQEKMKSDPEHEKRVYIEMKKIPINYLQFVVAIYEDTTH